MESMNKSKSKVIILRALCVGLLVSLGVNVWLYSQFSSINQGVKDIQAQQASIKSEYDVVSQKIKDGKQSLSTLQDENSQMN